MTVICMSMFLTILGWPYIPSTTYYLGLKRPANTSKGEAPRLAPDFVLVSFGFGTTRGSTGGAGGLVTCRYKNKEIHAVRLVYMQKRGKQLVTGALTLPMRNGNSELNRISH